MGRFVVLLRGVNVGRANRVPMAEFREVLAALGHGEVQTLAQAGERLVITDHAAYLHGPGGLLESRVGKALLGRAGRALTTRNWATVLKRQTLLRPTA